MRFTLGYHRSRECDELGVTVDYSTAKIVLPEWTVTITGRPVYGRLSGPSHRLGVSYSPRDGVVGIHHGIVGQSFDGVGPRYGAVDHYPLSGVFRTTAMAEGAIDGVAADYEVAAPHGTPFAYAMFNRTGGAPFASTAARARAPARPT